MAEEGFTKPSFSYPGYINIKHDGDSLLLTVRGDPTTGSGRNVCGMSCLPGGPDCNNYCNMAPSKGPMASAPLPRAVVKEGPTAQIRLSREDLEQYIRRVMDAFIP